MLIAVMNGVDSLLLFYATVQLAQFVLLSFPKTRYNARVSKSPTATLLYLATAKTLLLSIFLPLIARLNKFLQLKSYGRSASAIASLLNNFLNKLIYWFLTGLGIWE